MTDIEAGPPDLLKVIRCGCKGPCRNSCSCRKTGLNCAFTCKECHGITYTNAQSLSPKLRKMNMKEICCTYLISLMLYLIKYILF